MEWAALCGYSSLCSAPPPPTQPSRRPSSVPGSLSAKCWAPRTSLYSGDLVDRFIFLFFRYGMLHEFASQPGAEATLISLLRKVLGLEHVLPKRARGLFLFGGRLTILFPCLAPCVTQLACKYLLNKPMNGLENNRENYHIQIGFKKIEPISVTANSTKVVLQRLQCWYIKWYI